MEERDDDDLKVQRTTLEAIELIKTKIPRLLHEFDREERLKRSEGRVRAEIREVVALLDVFQEEPQLLDPHLKVILPPLIARFVRLIHSGNLAETEFTNEGPLHGIAEIIYTLCKVRGEKVVIRFLNNEPHHILAVLNALKSNLKRTDACTASSTSNDKRAPEQNSALSSNDGDWKLRYALLLWTGHLVLTPFDLSSISGGRESLLFDDDDLSLGQLPKIAKSIVDIALSFLESPTKEQSSAASMLVKLVLRPDMLKTKTLDRLVPWCLRLLPMKNDGHASIYKQFFVLRVLYGLVQSADVRDICHQFHPIFQIIVQIFGGEQENLSSAQKSAVARKLAIKLLRSITVQTLQLGNTDNESLQGIFEKLMQQIGVLEESIDLLLRRLADPDAQVRYAASKALSIITVKLDKDMGEEVVEAIIGSLGEDVFGEGESRDLSSVNPLRWHGLTLTLSHMLFRRSPSPVQLAAILNALYLTLTFEQRSTTGNSVGTNVRDASNFGLWSLARRYKTIELLDASPALAGFGSRQQITVSMIQNTANNLLASACLDPTGNVRRGSSAALQELIGRHPDEVKDGIALVQIVDYQAVGLRRRAMVEVAAKAVKLGNMYLSELLDGLFGWRGLQAPDAISRNFAALSMAQLSINLPEDELDAYFSRIISKLSLLSKSDIERRHGLIKALSESVLQQLCTMKDAAHAGDHMLQASNSGVEYASKILMLWNLFGNELEISQKNTNLTSARSGLTTESTISLISALSSYTLSYKELSNDNQPSEDDLILSLHAALKILCFCLKSTDAATLEAIPRGCTNICSLLPCQTRMDQVKSWMLELKPGSKTHRRSGTMLAVASSWSTLGISMQEGSTKNEIEQLKEQILDALISIFQGADVDARVMAIRCLKMIVDAAALQDRNETIQSKLLSTFAAGLNDYTINERGDVGSLVRLEAIDAMRHVWSARSQSIYESDAECYSAVQRLALERLDKVRLQASQCLHLLDDRFASKTPETQSDVSTSEYFLTSAISHLTTSREQDERLEPAPTSGTLLALIEGFASSAGGGVDSVITTARSALSALCDVLPVYPQPNPDASKTPSPSLLDLANALLAALRNNQNNDRVLVPLLEMASFLFDAGILQRLDVAAAVAAAANNSKPTHPPPLKSTHSAPLTAAATARQQEEQQNRPPSFPFRTLLSLTQKAHFKSAAMPKLLASLHIYAHLATIPATQRDARRKMAGMLAHPFPAVRAAAGEGVWRVLALDAAVGMTTEERGGEGWATAVRERLKRRDWRDVSAAEGKAFADELGRLWGVV